MQRPWLAVISALNLTPRERRIRAVKDSLHDPNAKYASDDVKALLKSSQALFRGAEARLMYESQREHASHHTIESLILTFRKSAG